jgi:hypothetical protein
MQDLIDRLKKEVGLTDQQALQAIRVIKEFAAEKFPVFAGAINKLFDKYAPAEDEEDFLQ